MPPSYFILQLSTVSVLCHYLIYYLIFILGFKIRKECTIHWNKKKRKKLFIEDFELANSDPKSEDYQSANSSL